MSTTNVLRIFRNGFAPAISTAGLLALEKALESEDPRIVQGTTAHPACGESLLACATCPLAYCGWQGDGLNTVAEVESYFSKLCAAADERLGEPLASVDFLNWVDDTSPAKMRRLLLQEVKACLAERVSVKPAVAA